MVIALLAGVAGGRDRTEEMMAFNKAFHLAIRAQELYGMPVEKKPKIFWNYDDDWKHSAYADCEAWTIELNHRVAIQQLDIMLQKVLPHEVGHLVYCYMNGGTVGENPHNKEWQRYVAELGGDPNFF